MSVIAIIVDEPDIAARTLMKLNRILGTPLGELRSAIRQRAPIWQHEIFDTEYEIHAAKVRMLLECLETAGLHSLMYELGEGSTVESCPNLDHYRITSDVLRNILDGAGREIDRQQDEIDR